MAEEIFEDPSREGGIASECVGTRTGLRGQPNQCSLRELCEYLWVPTHGEEETDRTRTNWIPFTEAIADKMWSKTQKTSVTDRMATIVKGVKLNNQKG
jgi:hypothetical protein